MPASPVDPAPRFPLDRSFPSPPVGVAIPDQERGILALWDRIDAFRRSVAKRPADRRYVFYDGPPFATGTPHYGHFVPNTIKDVVPRYWTMRGYRVERRFGWDTHGLPIEMLMEKKLGLSGPSSIRAYGVAKFNEACRDNVFTFVDDWRRAIGRLGRWVDFDDDYKTLDPTFMESVWWAFRSLWDQGLVYRDFRVMPYSWRLSTSLSNFEAGLDYREVQDPSLFVAVDVVGAPGGRAERLLLWTTTPWTLPSNLAVAVGPDLPYVRARRSSGDDTLYVVAEARLAAVLGADAVAVEGPFPGSALLGTKYTPLFPYFADRASAEPGRGAFRVIAAAHVTTEDGTGLVHMAPDYGEADFDACRAEGIDVVLSVDEEGNFGPAVVDFAGRNVKEADHDIIRWLKDRGNVFHHGTLAHSYPYCWRSGTPLIYKALPAWFVSVTKIRDRMVSHNRGITWVPEAIGAGRFGNWLSDARDWNVSRNRFWGTPIPLWQCPTTDAHRVCIGSIRELEERTGSAPGTVTDLHPHRVDHLTFPCPACAAVGVASTMRRITDVFDCWFESGAMPYGQAHYPFEAKETFEAHYPAQFISEGLDQTRGWFYTLLVLSTALFDRPPFVNCVVNGLVLAADGRKMSKSEMNYTDPEVIFERYGADALRAYLIDSPVVRGESLRFVDEGVHHVVRTVLLPLHNAHAFFVQYANVDGWRPTDPRPDVADRPELDRWVLSHLQSLIATVDTEMEQYRLYNVVTPVLGFIDDLTNWYIRSSRRRFWRKADTDAARADKAAAYATLYEVLVTFARVLAPFLPFVSEVLYQSLVVGPGAAKPDEDSVHLTDWPLVKGHLVDRPLEAAVEATRQVVRLGRRLRERHKLKTRQPLRRLTVVHHDAAFRQAIAQHEASLLEELNVKAVTVVASGDELASVTCKANFKTLGKRYGKDMKTVAAAIEAFGAPELGRLEAGDGIDVLGQLVVLEDVVVRREPRADVVIETDGALVVALDPTLDDGLVEEGVARELVSALQKLRKDAGLAITDRVRVWIGTADPLVVASARSQGAFVAGEVLADAAGISVGAGDAEGGTGGEPLVRAALALSSVRGEHAVVLALYSA